MGIPKLHGNLYHPARFNGVRNVIKLYNFLYDTMRYCLPFGALRDVPARYQKKDHSEENQMNVGDVRRIRNNQDYTISSAQNQLCIIELITPEGSMYVRIENPDGSHYHQYVEERHLER